jgi:trimeric autotransporter adhesin
VNRIASWDGAQCSGLGTGVNHSLVGGARVESLASFGGELIAGGFFETAGAEPSFNFARWDVRRLRAT